MRAVRRTSVIRSASSCTTRSSSPLATSSAVTSSSLLAACRAAGRRVAGQAWGPRSVHTAARAWYACCCQHGPTRRRIRMQATPVATHTHLGEERQQLGGRLVAVCVIARHPLLGCRGVGRGACWQPARRGGCRRPSWGGATCRWRACPVARWPLARGVWPLARTCAARGIAPGCLSTMSASEAHVGRCARSTPKLLQPSAGASQADSMPATCLCTPAVRTSAAADPPPYAPISERLCRSAPAPRPRFGAATRPPPRRPLGVVACSMGEGNWCKPPYMWRGRGAARFRSPTGRSLPPHLALAPGPHVRRLHVLIAAVDFRLLAVVAVPARGAG